MASKPTSLILKIAAAVLVLAAAGYWFFFWDVPLVKVAKVVAGQAVNAVSGSVTVRAEYDKDLTTEVGGRVAESFMEVDKRVKAGEVLLRIDTEDVKLEIERMENEYEAAKKAYATGSTIALELEAAKEALVAVERQAKIGMLSESELNRQKRLVQGIEQRLEQEKIQRALNIANLENGLKAKRRQVEKMTVLAPYDGIITTVNVRKNDLIGGGTAIAHIIATHLIVEAKLSEENIAGVKLNQKAYVTFLPFGMLQFEAKVTKILSSADPATQRYPVWLDVSMPTDKPLVPGMTGEVSIILAERPAKTNVPRMALIGDRDRLFVVSNGKAQLRQVKAGFLAMTAAEILEGVSPGELVVVDHLDKLSDGTRVKTELVEDTRWR